MGWRWATALLLGYLIFMHSFWNTERTTVWGQWRKVWEEGATADWARQRAALEAQIAARDTQIAHVEREIAPLQLMVNDLRAQLPVPIAERTKWTRPRWGMK